MRVPPLFKNVLTVSSGAAVGQVLSFLAMPVLSRFYSAESFGALGTFLSVASMLGSLATLQYGVALMLPKRNAEAANVFMLGCLSVTAVTILVSFFVACFQELSSELLKTNAGTFLWLLPLYVFCNGASQMLTGWSVRTKQFKQNSASQIVRSFTVNSIQIAAAPASATGGVLAIGAVLGEVGSCINLTYFFLKYEKRFFARCFSPSRIKQLARKYYDFPAFSTPQNLLNACSQGLPVLLLGNYYGIEVAGLYAFAIRFIQAPMGLLLNPLRQVLFQRFCDVSNQGGGILPLFRKSTFCLLAVVVLPLIVGLIFLPTLFAIIFGESWRQAGELGRWLLIWQAFMFCNVPSILMARILRIQHQMLMFDIATLALRCTVLVAGGLYLDFIHTIASFCLLGALLNLLLILYIWQRVQYEHLSTQQVFEEAEAV